MHQFTIYTLLFSILSMTFGWSCKAQADPHNISATAVENIIPELSNELINELKFFSEKLKSMIWEKGVSDYAKSKRLSFSVVEDKVARAFLLCLQNKDQFSSHHNSLSISNDTPLPSSIKLNSEVTAAHNFLLEIERLGLDHYHQKLDEGNIEFRSDRNRSNYFKPTRIDNLIAWRIKIGNPYGRDTAVVVIDASVIERQLSGFDNESAMSPHLKKYVARQLTKDRNAVVYSAKGINPSGEFSGWDAVLYDSIKIDSKISETVYDEIGYFDWIRTLMTAYQSRTSWDEFKFAAVFAGIEYGLVFGLSVGNGRDLESSATIASSASIMTLVIGWYQKSIRNFTKMNERKKFGREFMTSMILGMITGTAMGGKGEPGSPFFDQALHTFAFALGNAAIAKVVSTFSDAGFDLNERIGMYEGNNKNGKFLSLSVGKKILYPRYLSAVLKIPRVGDALAPEMGRLFYIMCAPILFLANHVYMNQVEVKAKNEYEKEFSDNGQHSAVAIEALNKLEGIQRYRANYVKNMLRVLHLYWGDWSDPKDQNIAQKLFLFSQSQCQVGFFRLSQLFSK